MIEVLLRPFAFFCIGHPQIGTLIRAWPAVIAALLAFGYELLPGDLPLVGIPSMSGHLISIFSILPGFYIAALAAVATFNRPEMDETMPTPAPKLRLRTQGHTSSVPLTLRLFTSHLFAFLTTLSFLAVLFFATVDLVAPVFAPSETEQYGVWATRIVPALEFIYVFLAMWLTSLIILVTLVGLYFLAEHIHRPAV